MNGLVLVMCSPYLVLCLYDFLFSSTSTPHISHTPEGKAVRHASEETKPPTTSTSCVNGMQSCTRQYQLLSPTSQVPHAGPACGTLHPCLLSQFQSQPTLHVRAVVAKQPFSIEQRLACRALEHLVVAIGCIPGALGQLEASQALR